MSFFGFLGDPVSDKSLSDLVTGGAAPAGGSREELESLRRLAALEAKAAGADPTGQAGTLQFGPIDTGIPIPAALNDSLAGAGKFFSDTGRAARQMSSGISHAAGLVPDQYMARKAAEDAEQERLDKPLMDTFSGNVGNVTGMMATALAAPVSTITEGGAVGAALGALQPVKDGWDRVKNTVEGGVFGGLGQAVANGAGAVWRWLRSPASSVLSDGDKAVVQRALDLGYELTPDQVTGRNWQRNLQAALDTFPTTAGRTQARVAANQANTDRLVQGAVDSVGGSIDQPAAAAAAIEGWKKGLGAEKTRLGNAYDSVLSGNEVNLESARPGLEALRAEQQQLPATSRTGQANAALDELLGSPAWKPGNGLEARPAPTVNPNVDDIVTAVRKLGGINPGDEAVGTLAHDMPFGGHPQDGPVWRQPTFNQSGSTTSGHSLDRMTELLHGQGYVADRNALDDVMEKLYDSSRGIGSHFSDYRTPPNQDPLAAAIEQLTAQMQSKAAPAAPAAGYIRDNPSIPGDTAQTLRSDYSGMSASAKGNDRLVYGQMKSAIDGAIESSLPAEARAQFQAVNRRYGIYKAVEALDPTQQDAFLQQLYRGSKSPDQFYSFVGMAPDAEFKQVARGFISRLVEGATGEGGVNAAKLGRELDKVNPDARRFFAGDAGDVLADVGNIGQNVLSSKVPNSGTAQRLLWQALIQAPGAAVGGYEGAKMGGVKGALEGAGVGAMAGRFVMPKLIQGAYLSGAARPFLTREQQPYVQSMLADALRRYGALSAAAPAQEMRR